MGQGSLQYIYVWGIIVSCITDLHNKYGHGVKYFDPTCKLQKIISGVLYFVDDFNVSNTGEK